MYSLVYFIRVVQLCNLELVFFFRKLHRNFLTKYACIEERNAEQVVFVHISTVALCPWTNNSIAL
jgi:hypothetical protein